MSRCKGFQDQMWAEFRELKKKTTANEEKNLKHWFAQSLE